jgi:metallo-beta-lactamase family protein
MSRLAITFHGAAQRVTGSCAIVQAGDKKICVDCGMSQDRDAYSMPFDPKDLDAVVLTHAHLDHCGMVPLLYERGFRGSTFAQYATGEIAPLIWQDNYRIGMNNGMAPYSEQALNTARKSIEYRDYDQPFAAGDLRMHFYDAGHILGSSHVSLEYAGKSIVFSGDIGVDNTPIINDPKKIWPIKPDAVVIESTYGNRRHKSRRRTVGEFGAIVTRVVDNRGVLLIPAFSIGRTQEILYHLNTLAETRLIPPVPVFLDSPMGRRVTELYRAYTVCYDDETYTQIERGDQPLEFPGLKIIESYDQSKSIDGMRPPFIVIAGSGMCTGGRIIHHLKTFLPLRTTTVMFVGWQGKGTLGRVLVDGASEVAISGERTPVCARIATLNGFSAHADKGGLVAWAKCIPGNPRWLVNHGESEAAEALAKELKAQTRQKALAVREGETVEV